VIYVWEMKIMEIPFHPNVNSLHKKSKSVTVNILD